ncbi:hypothetical protein LTR94_027139 [Friedmanniomyces endolithicus]|nr:hypothetical protein LTR94_027139 [Friedmanniomyces endolithicus]
MGRVSLLAVGLFAAFATPCAAQEVQSYSYDPHGRLTSLHRDRGGSFTVTEYGLDAADNRAARATGPTMTAMWEAEALPHGTGFADDDGWAANIYQAQGHLTYGPYTPSVPTGSRIAVWRAMVDWVDVAASILAALVAALLASPTAVLAQQIDSHFYDVHGRLKATVKALPMGGSVTRYGLDAADNRTDRLTETAPTRFPAHELHSGQFFMVTQGMTSADGRFSLNVQTDGNIVLYGPPGALWVAPWTWGRESTTMTMQTDGNLTVRGPNNELIWQSGTGGNPGARFVVQNDGNLVIYSGWTALWASGTGGVY